MLINSIVLSILLATIGGAYLYWVLSERTLNRRNAENHAAWVQEEAEYQAGVELAARREAREPLAERIRAMTFDNVQHFGKRELEYLDHPLD